MPEKSDVFKLADAINSLRNEVRRAAERASKLPKAERFRITEAQIELTVGAEDSADAGGEVGWFIFKANAKIAAKDTVTHKLSLKLDLGAVEVGSETTTD